MADDVYVRSRLLRHLADRGIGAAVHYPTPWIFSLRTPRSATKTATSQACAQVLSLPLYPELTEDEVRRITAAVREAG